ncbi:MAG: hypothetical protein MZV70_01055 [Desulfobacterales bacterium]|nr:hypothetical protein [Desulfobacterales bacterium]
MAAIVPELKMPPASAAELAETVELMMVSVPEFSTAADIRCRITGNGCINYRHCSGAQGNTAADVRRRIADEGAVAEVHHTACVIESPPLIAAPPVIIRVAQGNVNPAVH